MKFTSQIVTGASGSIGGTTFSRNRFGMYQRAKGTPVNPNTSRQNVVRADFANAVQSWTLLTEAQRQGWVEYAQNTPTTDALGQSITLTGQQMYVRQFTLRSSFGAPPVTVAPVIFNRGETVSDITAAGMIDDDLVMTFALSQQASADGELALYVGRPQNASRRFYKGPYQLAAFASFSGAATTVNMTRDTTDEAAWFSQTVPAIGMHLPVRTRIAYADGRVSTSFRSIVELVDSTPE